MGYAQYRCSCGNPINLEIKSGRINITVTDRKKGISQILFFATNQPWVAEAKAKLPKHAIIKIRIPWGQLVIL